MQNTTNYNLNKPDGTDFAKIQSLNENADIVDEKLKELEDGLNNIDFSSITQQIATHTNNQQIHVTSAEKTRIGESYLAKTSYLLSGASVDFNTIGTNAVYQVGDISASLNAPPESWGILRDYKPNDTYRIQEFNAMVGDRKYTRRCDSSLAQSAQWTTWKQVGFDEHIYQQWNQGFATYQRFPEHCKLIYDWDTAIQNGFYMASENTANAPVNAWCMGTVIAHNELYVVQKVIEFTGTREFERRMQGGTWGPWVETSPATLFQSVSNGKSLIANAITQKGVATSATAEFATMAANISNISQGPKIASGTAWSNQYGVLQIGRAHV